jgi:hypothetical protein
MPEQYEKWVDAQLYSEKAADMFRNYKDVVFPLEKTKRASNLENMWKYVNLVRFHCPEKATTIRPDRASY